MKKDIAKKLSRFLHGSLMLRPEQVKTPAQVGLVNYHEIRIHTVDEKELRVWVKEAEESKPTIVYFHGRNRILESDSVCTRLRLLGVWCCLFRSTWLWNNPAF